LDTIFALATARGKSGVAVIRISGPQSFPIASRLTGVPMVPGRIGYRALKTEDGAVIDRGLVLAFAGPASFTGEDVVEFQVHGSLAVIDAVSQSISDTGLVRMAQAGEFARRALENGKLSVTEVEGLSDLVAAETEAQRKQAQSLMDGRLRTVVADIRGALLSAAAALEVTIDFAEDDVPENQTEVVLRHLAWAKTAILAEIAGSKVADRVRDGFVVAIVGEPNVGKSTLLNRIAGRDLALTSEQPGTTRDVIEARLDLGGLPVTFLDTAGLRAARDDIEGAGIDRARVRAAAADLRILLTSGNGRDDTVGIALEIDDIRIPGKSDITGDPLGVSGVTGAGVDGLLRRIEDTLARRAGGVGGAVNHRHRAILTDALHPIDRAIAASGKGTGAELIAADIREASDALGGLVGAVDVEEVLGAIFSRFCIGK